MKNIILLVILFVSLTSAQNCKQISDETKDSIKDDMWERRHTIMLVESGVICDNGLFYKSYYPSDDAYSCTYENWSKHQRTFIITIKDISYTSFQEFDEIGMEISRSELIKTSRSCIDIYKQFRREMK